MLTYTYTNTHMYVYMYIYPGVIAGPLLVLAMYTHTHTHTHTHMYVYMYIYPGVIAGPLLVHAKFPLTDQSLALCSNAIRLTMASLHKRVSLSSI